MKRSLTMSDRSYLPLSPAALLIILTVSVVILPLAPHLPLWLTLLCVCLITWRLLHDLGRVSLPGRYLRLLLILLALAGLFLSYYTLFGRTAGSAFLALLLCMKLMEMHTRRDRMVVIFLACFMVVIGFLFSQSIFIGVYMLFETILITTALISINHQPAGYLSQQTAYRTYVRLASRMVLQAAPLTMVLFILFPRVPGPLWGMPEDVASASTGLSEEMSPGRFSQLSNNDAVAFRVKFHGAVPPQSELYWRGPVLWNFNGYDWNAPKAEFLLRLETEFEATGPAIDYVVTLEPHQQRWLFALDLPAMLPPKSRMSAELQLLSLQPVNKITRYELRSHTHYRIEPNAPPHLQRYLALPANIAPRSQQLVQTWQQQLNSHPKLIQKALDYFRNEEFYYSRQPPLLFDDPVDEFLFQTRKGYCEHFASAFTVMMRQAGIPARVVTGYQGGEMNPLSDYMIVRQSDAHAWSEVWLSGEGWLRIDPTSVIPAERIESSEDLLRRQTTASRERQLLELSWLGQSVRQARYAWDAVNNRWNQWIVGFNEKRQLALLSSLGMPNIHWQGMTLLLFTLLTAILLLFGLYLLRRNNPSMDPANQLYQRFLLKLEKVGFIKQDYESALCFASRIKSSRQDLATEVDDITRFYNKLRYTAHPPQYLLARLQSAIKQFQPQRFR
jgi:transglutaminase-like putative cysteine protease